MWNVQYNIQIKYYIKSTVKEKVGSKVLNSKVTVLSAKSSRSTQLNINLLNLGALTTDSWVDEIRKFIFLSVMLVILKSLTILKVQY